MRHRHRRLAIESCEDRLLLTAACPADSTEPVPAAAPAPVAQPAAEEVAAAETALAWVLEALFVYSHELGLKSPPFW